MSTEQSVTNLSARNTVGLRMTNLMGSYPDLSSARPSTALLSTNELAGLTGFAPKTIRRWACRRLLNYIRVGNQFRFRPAAVELFLRQREVRK
jgi:excisionase family DNA binding protein